MKGLIVSLAAALALTGCIAVPYYGEPAPYYGYYGAPAPGGVYFNYSYRDGGYRHQRRHW